MQPSPKLRHLVATVTLATAVSALLFLPGWSVGTLTDVTAASRLEAPPGPAPSPPATAEAVPDDPVRPVVPPREIDAPDPFLVMDDGRPWLFTTNTLHHVPVRTVDELGEWTVAEALPLLPAWAEPGRTWAPAVTRTPSSWVLAFTARHRDLGRQCIGVATAATVGGPYVPQPEPLVCDVTRGGSIDPSFTVDDDGTLWLLYKDDGNCCRLPTALRSVPLTANGLALAGTPTELVRADLPWEEGLVEAPSMTKVGDRWLLLYSAGRWDNAAYAVGAAWCASPAGPCLKQPAPALTGGANPDLDGPGGLELVAGGPPGEGPFVVFHAWPEGAVGYDQGGVRHLHLGEIQLTGDFVAVIPAPAIPPAG